MTIIYKSLAIVPNFCDTYFNVMIVKNPKFITTRPNAAVAPTRGGSPRVSVGVNRNLNPTRIATQMGVLGSGGDVITFTMANGNAVGGAIIQYVIGDADGAVADALGRTVTNATSDAFSATIQKNRFATRPAQVDSMLLQTSSNAAQFRQQYSYGWVENDGSSYSKKVRIGQFASPSDQNDLLRPVTFKGMNQEIVLGPDSGLFFSVLGGETLTAFVQFGEQTR